MLLMNNFTFLRPLCVAAANGRPEQRICGSALSGAGSMPRSCSRCGARSN